MRKKYRMHFISKANNLNWIFFNFWACQKCQHVMRRHGDERSNSKVTMAGRGASWTYESTFHIFLINYKDDSSMSESWWIKYDELFTMNWNYFSLLYLESNNSGGNSKIVSKFWAYLLLRIWSQKNPVC